jgi:diaminopimelate decarboxylase
MSFEYKDGHLAAENIAVRDISKKVGTPFYCYSKDVLQNNYKSFQEGFSSYPTTICFAIKANSNLSVLKILSDMGAGADTVSQGEIMRAIKAGIPAGKIVFSGVGKTIKEMEYALNQNIGQFNVESRTEVRILNEVAKKLGKKANISIRVNPDINANTHEKITTGRKIDKFGIPWDEVDETFAMAKQYTHLEVQGIACHIGSQITNIEPFIKTARKISELANKLLKQGFNLKRLDLGGGLGIKYKDEQPIDIADYARIIIDSIKDTKLQLFIEPGRRIAADAGILVSEVQYIKKSGEREFLILDAGMNDIMRPAIYTAYHEIIAEKEGDKEYFYDIVGPVCESSDIFGRQRELPHLEAGDLVAIKQAGAYGMSMANNYNTRPIIPEILVEGDNYRVIRERQTLEEIINYDII